MNDQPTSVDQWFAEVELSLPIATFGHGETTGEAFDRRGAEDGRTCRKCGGQATAAFLSGGEVARWLDLCAPCAQWVKEGTQA